MRKIFHPHWGLKRKHKDKYWEKKIQRGLADVKAGRITSLEEFRESIGAGGGTVDTADSKSVAERREGSTPSRPIKKARPGDSGPCHICGEDMAAQLYDDWEDFMLVRPEHLSRGRYWHMKYEHGIWEDYDLNP